VYAGGAADARLLGLRWAGWVFAAATGLVGIGWLMAEPIVRLLFERGAFIRDDTDAVAAVLRYLLLQAPFYASGLVLISVLAAQGRYRAIAAISGANLLVKVAGAAWLTERLQLTGLALSTSMMYMTSLGLTWVAVWHGGRMTRP
jgi:peptidoglycan biosynthesis protein MviN/MurJ (putative lipid II flippase)